MVLVEEVRHGTQGPIVRGDERRRTAGLGAVRREAIPLPVRAQAVEVVLATPSLCWCQFRPVGPPQGPLGSAEVLADAEPVDGPVRPAEAATQAALRPG